MLNFLAALFFQNPKLLWLLTLVIIPIIVHLFNLRRTKKIIFSNTAFLRKVKEESSAKRKPKELLILITRLLGVILLVLAFAQPTIKVSDNLESQVDSVLIYLDNSPSSLEQVDGETLFDRAVKIAESIISAYPDGTSFSFIENSYSNSLKSKYTKSSLKDQLTELTVVNVGRTNNEIEDRIDLSQRNGDLYWISDFQNINSNWETDSLLNYRLIPLVQEASNNIYFDSVYLENSFLSGSFSNELVISLNSTEVENIGTSARVYLNDRLTGTFNIDIQNGKGLGRFEFPKEDSILSDIRLSIDDAILEYDNDFYLSINSLKLTNVLEVFDEGSPPYISQLFAENEYFNFNKINANRIDQQLFSSADFILINGLGDYSNQLINEIKLAKESGATIVIIPNETFNNSQLIDLGIRMISDVAEEVNLQAPNFSDPFFEGVFEDEEANMQMPFAKTNYRLLNVEYILLELLNGRPFLAKVATEGNVFTFSSPFTEESTSFVNHALFVPVFYRMALGSKRNFAKLYYSTDSESVSYPFQGKASGQIFDLTNESISLTPDQRQNSSELIMYIPKDEIVPGNYRVASGQTQLGNIAFNLPKSESESNPKRDEILIDLAKNQNVELFEVSNAEELSTELRSDLTEITLWKTALLLGLLFLFVEIILIRYL